MISGLSSIKEMLFEVNADSLKLFLFFLLVFTLFAHTVGDNENSRLGTTIALVEDQSLSLNGLESYTNDLSSVDGSYYSDKAPLPSLLAVPSYFVVDNYFERPITHSYYSEGFNPEHNKKLEWAKLGATFSVSAVSGALTCVLIFLIAMELGIGRNQSLFVSLLSGLSTLIFPYSTTFHGTMLGTLFLTAATLLWIKTDYCISGKTAFLLSAVIGLGVSSSYLIVIPGGLLLFLNSVGQIKDYNTHLIQFSGLILGLSPLLAVNYLVTGNPLEPTILYSVTAESPEFLGYGIFNLSLSLSAGRMLRSLFSPLNGLLIYSPILIFGILGFRKLYSLDRRPFYMILGGFIGNLILISLVPLTNIRAFYGPRYLLPAATLLIIPLILELERSGKIEQYLIYFTGLISGIIMWASTQAWIGAGWENIDPDHTEKITSLNIYENRLGHYLSNLLSEGLQSPLLSYLTKITPELNMAKSHHPEFSIVIGEFQNLIVLYDVRVLSVLLIVLAGLLIFKKRIIKNQYISPKNLFVVLVIFASLGLSSTTTHLSGWYPDLENETEQWGKENPRIYFTSETNLDKKMLEIDAQSNENKKIDIFFNNELIRQTEITTSGIQLSELVELEQGINKISFRTDRCTKIEDVADNDDIRCTSFGIRDFTTNALEEGSYITESPGYNQADQSSKIYFRADDKTSIEFTVSSDSRTKINLTDSNKETRQIYVDQYPSKVKTPYKYSEGINSIELESHCRNCTITLEDIEVKRFSEQPEDLLYRLSKNWYQKNENEAYSWSTADPKIMIYNYQDEPKKRELWLEGRSYAHDRKINFSLNNELIGAEIVPKTTFRDLSNGERIENKFRFDVVIEPGENILELEISDECTVVSGHIGNDDLRCINYGFKDLYLTS